MHNFAFTNKFLTKNGEPWCPVMGEIHYARTNRDFWPESLAKMKAGGVSIVSSYVFWLYHEEIEGQYDFSGNKDIRAFVQACKESGLYFFLRIGPWCHGEVRNGGFPDWLLHKSYEPRTNDLAYLQDVERFFCEIFKEVQGLFYKDGGPIIGVQIENEYGHCGGLAAQAAEEHMRLLTNMAKRIGFDVPYYTATGWGGGVTGGLLPVMSCYCDAPWDASTEELTPSGNYIFTPERNDSNVGSDRGLGEGLTFDTEQFPFLMAELGGGLQVTHHRRTVPTAQDIGAMSLVKLGSGANLLGYYMYHGGTNPVGKLSTFQESKETGYSNDLPVLTYDFHAPVREYRQISETYKEIKCLALFLQDFGAELCKMEPYFPSENPMYPTDNANLRYCWRHNGASGYLFVNNYQRHQTMACHNDVSLALELSGKRIAFPLFNVENGSFFFYPFEMPLDSGVLHSATATPLCRIANEETTAFFFYTNGEPNFCVSKESAQSILVCLTKYQALNAWKVRLAGREYLFLSENAVLECENSLMLMGTAQPEFAVYPTLPEVPQGFYKEEQSGVFTRYVAERSYKPHTESVRWTPKAAQQFDEIDYILEVPAIALGESAFLELSYEGDRAELFCNGQMVADNFYDGTSWEIGLKDLGYPRQLELRIFAMPQTQAVYLEPGVDRPGSAAIMIQAELVWEYCYKLYPRIERMQD